MTELPDNTISKELRDFSDAATRGWSARPERDDELELDENELDDEADADESDENLPAGWLAWADGLNAGDRQHAIDDPNWAQYQFELWLTRPENAAVADVDEDADAATEDGPRNAGELADWVMENAALLRREYGYTPAEYLAWIGGMSRSQWAAFKAEAGFADSLERPSYSELPKAAQAARVAADKATWTPETFKRLG